MENNLKLKNIVFIADSVKNHIDANQFSDDLECPDENYCQQVILALKNIGKQVYHYARLEDFSRNIYKHKNDILISIYSGKNSYSRKGLVASLCETNDICYAGADAYTQILCSDKYLCKRYCEHFNIYGAKDALITNEKDINQIFKLKLPLVVKPNNEGGSNGISQDNLVNTYDEAIHLIKLLLSKFEKILVEELIEGIEFTTSIVGTRENPQIIGQTQIDVENTTKIFGFESKKKKSVKISNKNIDILNKNDKENIIELYKSFGKVDYMRVDGIMSGNKFYLLELSPDTNLGKSSTFAQSFIKNGYTYEQMLNYILNVAIESYQLKSAKKK